MRDRTLQTAFDDISRGTRARQRNTNPTLSVAGHRSSANLSPSGRQV